ncbi:glycosyltransferase family 2 protein [Latilactobacillus curvatus]|uniref:glycosyltransferase n=2 Tax=Latilactobacillus curvatus TaxID=28038 RepID=UPI0030015EDF
MMPILSRKWMHCGNTCTISNEKVAILDVGGWQAEQPTEDIAISWDMQVHGWQAYFAPHIRFFMDVPETLPELVKQRRR